MIVSPIKSVIKNLTDTQVVIQVTRTRKIYVAPCDQDKDAVIVAGDIFSQFDYDKNAQRLAERVMNGVVAISYIIEDPYTVEKTTSRSVLLSSDLIEKYESWLGAATQNAPDKGEEGAAEANAEANTEDNTEDNTDAESEKEQQEAGAPIEDTDSADAEAPTEAPAEEQQEPVEKVSEPEKQGAEETQESEDTEEKKENTDAADATEVDEPVSKKRTTRKLKVQ